MGDSNQDGRTAAGVVLAAGSSRRFGAANKLLAPLFGRPLAAHAAATMRNASVSPRIAVVADLAVAELFEGYQLVSPEGQDQAASLRAGVRAASAAGANAVLVMLADMPLIDDDHLTEICRRGARTGAAASTDGKKRLPPVWFDEVHFPALLAMQGDRGARDLLAGLGAETLVRVPDDLLADVDTVAELMALKRS